MRVIRNFWGITFFSILLSTTAWAQNAPSSRPRADFPPPVQASEPNATSEFLATIHQIRMGEAIHLLGSSSSKEVLVGLWALQHLRSITNQKAEGLRAVEKLIHRNYRIPFPARGTYAPAARFQAIRTLGNYHEEWTGVSAQRVAVERWVRPDSKSWSQIILQQALTSLRAGEHGNFVGLIHKGVQRSLRRGQRSSSGMVQMMDRIAAPVAAKVVARRGR